MSRCYLFIVSNAVNFHMKQIEHGLIHQIRGISDKHVGLIISPTTQLGVVKCLPMTTLNKMSKEATLNAAMLNLLTLQWCGKTENVKIFVSTWYKSLSHTCASNFNSIFR